VSRCLLRRGPDLTLRFRMGIDPRVDIGHVA
jgi:hypothetical protein